MIAVHVDDRVPLMRPSPNGGAEDVLYWRKKDMITVHPERWDAFWAALNGRSTSPLDARVLLLRGGVA